MVKYYPATEPEVGQRQNNFRPEQHVTKMVQIFPSLEFDALLEPNGKANDLSGPPVAFFSLSVHRCTRYLYVQLLIRGAPVPSRRSRSGSPGCLGYSRSRSRDGPQGWFVWHGVAYISHFQLAISGATREPRLPLNNLPPSSPPSYLRYRVDYSVDRPPIGALLNFARLDASPATLRFNLWHQLPQNLPQHTDILRIARHNVAEAMVVQGGLRGLAHVEQGDSRT